MATLNQQSVCVAADNHWLRYCPSSIARAHTNHIKKVVPEPRYLRPEHKSDTDCMQVQRQPGDTERKGLDKQDDNDRKGVETLKDVMNNRGTAIDTNESAHYLQHERRSVHYPGQHKITSGSGGNTSQDLESNCTKSKDKTTQRNRNMRKTFIPWKAQSDLNLNFSVECMIDNCNCIDSFDKQLSNMLLGISDDGLSDPADIGSRVRNYKCSLPGCECSENEWKHFVPEDSALDTPSQKTEKEKDQSKDVGEMLTDKSDSDDSYELLEWDKTIADVTNLSGMAEQDKTCLKIVSDSELVSISNDPTDLEGYHTAPNSPASLAEDYYIIDGQANTTNHATVNVRDRCTDNRTKLEKMKCTDTSKSEECTRCAKCNKPISEPKTSASSSQICTSKDSQREQPGNHEGTIHVHMNQDDLNPFRQEIFGNHGKPLLNLELPPFIPASSINYEGNPATYEVDVVGRGSFGTVYKARFSDPMFSQLPIVVKECDEEFSNAKEIIEEAQKLYYLQETGYVPMCYGILCYGPAAHRKFGIVQEFVGTGLTLEQMMWDRFDLPVEYAFRIALQCCEGLARFHEKGILLNDIKSNNILLEFIPNSVQIKYIDFGLATDMRGKRYKNTKSLEDFFYLAPEVRVNGGTTSVASDIFSLGFMLEQLRKFSGPDELSIVARLFMDIDPTMRIPVRGAISLIIDQMTNLGLDG